jgi:hypothetical protein
MITRKGFPVEGIYLRGWLCVPDVRAVAVATGAWFATGRSRDMSLEKESVR